MRINYELSTESRTSNCPSRMANLKIIKKCGTRVTTIYIERFPAEYY